MKQLLLFTLILAAFGASAQTYAGAGLQTGGVSYMVGYKVTGSEEPARLENFDFALQYRRPFTSNEDPKTLGASVGYEIGERFSITPSIAYNLLWYKDYSAYDHDEFGAVVDVTELKESYALELAWNFKDGNANGGRLSYKAVVLKGNAYHGIFCRIYFNRSNQ